MITKAKYDKIRNAIEDGTLPPEFEADAKAALAAYDNAPPEEQAARGRQEFAKGQAAVHEPSSFLPQGAPPGRLTPEESLSSNQRLLNPEAPKPAPAKKLASASQDPSVYAPPEYVPGDTSAADFTAPSPANGPALTTSPLVQGLKSAALALGSAVHFEPTHDQFEQAHPEYVGRGGEEYARGYQRFADELYKQHYADAVANGYPLKRNAYSEDQGWGEKIRRGGMELGHQVAGGLLAAPISGGLTSGTVGAVTGSSPEERNYLTESAGIGKPVGELYGSVANPVTGFAEGALPVTALTRLGRMGQRALGGAVMGGGTVAGDAISRGNRPDLGRTAIAAGGGAALNMALSPLLEAASNFPRKFREAEPNVPAMEQGGMGRTDVLGGVKPSPEAQRIITEGNQGDLRVPPRERFGNVEEARAGAVKEDYYARPEARPGPPKGEPVDRLLNVLKDSRQKLNGPDGEVMPGREAGAKKLDNYIQKLTDWTAAGGEAPAASEAPTPQGPKAASKVFEGEFTSAGQKVAPEEPMTGEVVTDEKRMLNAGNALPPSGWKPAANGALEGIPSRRQAMDYMLKRGGVSDEAIAKMSDDQAEVTIANHIAEARAAKKAGKPTPTITPQDAEGTTPEGARAKPKPSAAQEAATEPEIVPGAAKTEAEVNIPKKAEGLPYNAEQLDELIKGLDEMHQAGKANKEPLPGYDRIAEAAREVRDQFVGAGPNMPNEPGGWSKFKTQEADRIKGADALFQLQKDSQLHMRGWPIPIIPVPSRTGAMLRGDALLRWLDAHPRAGGLGAPLSDEKRRKLPFTLPGAGGLGGF